MIVALVLLLQDKYTVGKDEIPLKDVVENSNKVYVRASTLEKPLKFVKRLTWDKSAVGVMREGVGGRSMKIGGGEEALIHSQDVFLSLEAIEAVLCAKVTRDIGKVHIDVEPTGEVVKKEGLVAGDRMIDFVLPPLKKKDPVQLSKEKKRQILCIWASWYGGRDQLAAWQAIYVANKKDLAVVSIAVDASGAERPASYATDKMTFAMAHDAYWRTVVAFQFESFPKFVLVDELGFIRAITDTVDDAVAAWKKLEKPDSSSWKAWIADEYAVDLKATAESIEKDARMTLTAIPASWEGAIRAFAALCKQGKSADGIAVLKEYLKLKDTHTLIRRQKWAAEFPDKIYAGSLDEKWLIDQEDLEKRGG